MIEIGTLEDAIVKKGNHIKKKVINRALGAVTYSSSLVWMVCWVVYYIHVFIVWLIMPDSAETGVCWYLWHFE